MKKWFRGEYSSVFEWLLHLGPAAAALIINIIAAVILAITMWFVHWMTKR